MRSTDRIVDSRWAITTAVRPASRVAVASSMRRSDSASMLEVASSMITTSGSRTNARANDRSCFCPVDRDLPSSSTSWS